MREGLRGLGMREGLGGLGKGRIRRSRSEI